MVLFDKRYGDDVRSESCRLAPSLDLEPCICGRPNPFLSIFYR